MSASVITSQITLLQRSHRERFKVRIRHDYAQAESGWYADARDAYRAAEAQLVVKPGYVDTPDASDAPLAGSAEHRAQDDISQPQYRSIDCGNEEPADQRTLPEQTDAEGLPL